MVQRWHGKAITHCILYARTLRTKTREREREGEREREPKKSRTKPIDTPKPNVYVDCTQS